MRLLIYLNDRDFDFISIFCRRPFDYYTTYRYKEAVSIFKVDFDYGFTR